MTKKLLMGNEAMAHAALEAGVGVVAGYPGTPSSEIVETVARQVGRGMAHGVHVEWSTNEKVALELLFGASLAGKRGLFTCKQMGLNVASDALMSLNYVSVRAGLVLIVADDPGPISSQAEQDTRRFATFAKVPVLDPSSPEQAYAMVKEAFELSERFHTPVIVRPTTRVDHASTFIDVADETRARTFSAATGMSIEGPSNDPDSTQAIPSGFTRNPDKWIIFPRRAYEAHREINDRLADIAHVFASNPAFAQFNPMEEVAATISDAAAGPGVSLGIVASGISTAYAREALAIVHRHAEEAGLRVPAYRFMQIGTPYPFPEDTVADFTRGLVDILVLEELDYVVEDELTRFAGRTHAPFNVHGKLTGEARDRGENDIDDIALRIERFLGLAGRLSTFRLRDEARRAELGIEEGGPLQVRLDDEAVNKLPDRAPALCAGCPHRGSFYAVKRALGDTPAVLCGDIGCYTLGNAKPLDAVDTCLCMGGGVTMAQGIAVADPMKKAIAFIGDSTFFASGMTGIANAAYNGHDITVIVLDNSTTAMTGTQPHPGTGNTLMGGYSQPLDIESVLISCGIELVLRANPLDLEASTAVVGAALDAKGPSAVIFESPCAQIVPPDPPAMVNRNTCKGCKRCITTIGCPAISFNTQASGPRSGSRGQAVIDQTLCVGCNLCVQVCPFHAILPSEVVADLTVIEGASLEESFATERSPRSAASGHGANTIADHAAGFAAAAAAAAAAAEAAGKDAGFDVVVADEDASYNFDLADEFDVETIGRPFGKSDDELDPTLAFEPIVESANEPISELTSEPAGASDVETSSEPIDKPEEELASEPASELNGEPASKPEDEPENEFDTEPETESVSELINADEPEAELERDGENESSSDSFDALVEEPENEVATEPMAESDEETTADFVTESDGEAGIESAPEPDVEAGAEPVDEPDLEAAVEPADEHNAEETVELAEEPDEGEIAEPVDELDEETTAEPNAEPAKELPADSIEELDEEPAEASSAEPDVETIEAEAESITEQEAESSVEPGTERKTISARTAFGDPITPDDIPPYPEFKNPWELDRADALAPERVKNLGSNRADQTFVTSSALDPDIALMANDAFEDNWAVAGNKPVVENELVASEEPVVAEEPAADDAADTGLSADDANSAARIDDADNIASAADEFDVIIADNFDEGLDGELDNPLDNEPSESAAFDYAFVGNVAFEYESGSEQEVPTAEEVATESAVADASADGEASHEESASASHIPDFGVAADFEEEIEELEAEEAREAEVQVESDDPVSSADSLRKEEDLDD